MSQAKEHLVEIKTFKEGRVENGLYAREYTLPSYHWGLECLSFYVVGWLQETVQLYIGHQLVETIQPDPVVTFFQNELRFFPTSNHPIAPYIGQYIRFLSHNPIGNLSLWVRTRNNNTYTHLEEEYTTISGTKVRPKDGYLLVEKEPPTSLHLLPHSGKESKVSFQLPQCPLREIAIEGIVEKVVLNVGGQILHPLNANLNHPIFWEKSTPDFGLGFFQTFTLEVTSPETPAVKVTLDHLTKAEPGMDYPVLYHSGEKVIDGTLRHIGGIINFWEQPISTL